MNEKLKNIDEVSVDLWKKRILSNLSSLEHAPDAIKDDKDFLLTIFKTNSGLMLKHASERLKNDKDVVQVAIKENVYALRYISEQLKNDECFMIDFIKIPGIIDCFGVDLLSDKRFVLKLINENPWGIKKLSDELRDDEDVIFMAIKHEPLCLKFASQRLLNKIDFAKKALMTKGVEFDWFSKRVKDDEECTLIATRNNKSYWLFASERLIEKIKIFEQRGISAIDCLVHLIEEKKTQNEKKILEDEIEVKGLECAQRAKQVVVENKLKAAPKNKKMIL